MNNLAIDIWSDQEALALRPPEKQTVSEWSEKNRHLSGRSAESGPFRNRRVPYLAPIMDSMNDPYVETVVLMKPAQIAGTTGMENICGYFSVTQLNKDWRRCFRKARR
jgi:phage terminase large subunit GpA-like protein